jgi:hypothetical protein
MKNTLSILFMLSVMETFTQGVGVGIGYTNRGRLEVVGVVGPGATVGLFGSGNTGISLQRNWPTIGFNQYRDDVAPGSQGKYIANGYAAIQYFDITSGTYAIDMFPSGSADNATPAGTRAITIGNNGNTGIRSTYLNASLVVARGDGTDGTAVFAGPNYWSHFNYSVGEDTYIRAGVDGGTVYINKTTNSSVLLGTTATHLGINSSNPFYTIEVYQPPGQKAFSMVDAYNYRWAMAANFINTPSNGTGVVLDFYYNNSGRGRFQYWDGNYIVLSDERLKKDIEPFKDVLDNLKNLSPMRYEMVRNNPKHEQSIGLIAQDVRPLFPGMVHHVVDHNRNGNPINDALVMDYSGFGVIAIKALQEQEHQIKALEKEKDALLAQLQQIEEKLKLNN